MKSSMALWARSSLTSESSRCNAPSRVSALFRSTRVVREPNQCDADEGLLLPRMWRELLPRMWRELLPPLPMLPAAADQDEEEVEADVAAAAAAAMCCAQ